MKYFLHNNLRGIKKPSQIKTKPLSKRGKNKVGKELERDLVCGKFFCYFF